VREHTVFNIKISRSSLECGLPTFGHAETGESADGVFGIELLDIQEMLSRSSHYAWHNIPIGWTKLDYADLMIKLLFAPLGQLPPKLIRPQQQRHIIRMLKIRLPNHSRPPM
jgi:hypothetical protein